MSWDPQRYLNFAGPRLRPALDLLARVDLEAPESVVDLGCGPGNVTTYLRQRWPQANILGLDNSPEMLATARASMPEIRWHNADASTWISDTPLSLIYSNAALHWVSDHAQLFPRLLTQLRPGGVLAVQMPRNFGRKTHTLVRQAAAKAGVTQQLQHLYRPPPTHTPETYYDILAPHCRRLDIWETDYLQVLRGENPVAEWTGGSWLRPFVAALAAEDRPGFVAAYRQLIAEAYPRRSDGSTLLPYLRLFIVATRA